MQEIHYDRGDRTSVVSGNALIFVPTPRNAWCRPVRTKPKRCQKQSCGQQRCQSPPFRARSCRRRSLPRGRLPRRVRSPGEKSGKRNDMKRTARKDVIDLCCDQAAPISIRDLNTLYAISLATRHEGGDASHLYEDVKARLSLMRFLSLPSCSSSIAMRSWVLPPGRSTCYGRMFSNEAGGRHSDQAAGRNPPESVRV